MWINADEFAIEVNYRMFLSPGVVTNCQEKKWDSIEDTLFSGKAIWCYLGLGLGEAGTIYRCFLAVAVSCLAQGSPAIRTESSFPPGTAGGGYPPLCVWQQLFSSCVWTKRKASEHNQNDHNTGFISFKKYLFLFICLAVLGRGCVVRGRIFSWDVQTPSGGLWTPAPWPGIEPRPPALGAQSPSLQPPGKSWGFIRF